MAQKYGRRVSAFIQVRMRSNRLPGKALSDIDGVTAIERVADSLHLSRLLGNIVIVTTTHPSDDPLEALARSRRLPFFRGDYDNIVKRFVDASDAYGTEVIVRATGDCPAVSHEVADYLVERHLAAGSDYTTIETDEVPVGIYPDVISTTALRKLAGFQIDFSYSEYLAFYFKNNPEYFSVNIAPALAEHRFPEYRLTLDYPEDLEMFRMLFKTLRERGMPPSLKNVITLLREDVRISSANSHLTLRYRTDEELIRKINAATRIAGRPVDGPVSP